MDAGERLRGWWKATGAEVKTRPASEAELAALEQRYGLSLPDDFRAYLLTSCPADEESWDAEAGTWWPLHRIRNIPEEYDHPVSDHLIAASPEKWLFFADHLSWCWAWAICCDDGQDRGRVAVIGASPDRIVADSFDEFIERYLQNWTSLI